MDGTKTNERYELARHTVVENLLEAGDENGAKRSKDNGVDSVGNDMEATCTAQSNDTNRTTSHIKDIQRQLLLSESVHTSNDLTPGRAHETLSATGSPVTSRRKAVPGNPTPSTSITEDDELDVATAFSLYTAQESVPGAYADEPGRSDNQRLPTLPRSLVGAAGAASSGEYDGINMLSQPPDYDSLVEAEPVDEERALATATPQPKENLVSSDMGKRLGESACLVGVAVTMTAAVVVLLLWSTRQLRESDSNNQSIGTGALPSHTELIPPHQLVEQYLPPESVLVANEDPESPQALAFDWLVKDPFLTNYTTQQRIQQRFALATIYFALNGTSWRKNTNWLSYDHHECLWYSGPSEDVIHELRPAQSPCRGNSDLGTTEHNHTGSSTNQWYTHLWLGRNNLNGELPIKELSLLSNLESIDMGWSKVRGKLFTEDLLKMSNLKELSLLVNQISGTVMTEIGTMSNLEVILMGKRGNRLEGTLPSSLGLLTNLEVLSFSGSPFTGTIPSEIGEMTNLKVLGLAGTLLTGSLPTEMGHLSSLWLTYLWGSQLTGPIPSEIANLKELSWFHIQGNAVSGSLPSELGSVSALRELGMAGNSLSGTIPWELGSGGAFFYLDLSRNQLEGTVPSHLGALSLLETMNLAQNHLSGQVPTEFGLLHSISHLQLNENSLEGSLPPELGLLEGLISFNVASNNISGEFQFADYAQSWPHITLLNVSLNALLSGTVPASLCERLNQTQMSFDCSENLCGCDYCACPMD